GCGGPAAAGGPGAGRARGRGGGGGGGGCSAWCVPLGGGGGRRVVRRPAWGCQRVKPRAARSASIWRARSCCLRRAYFRMSLAMSRALATYSSTEIGRAHV